MSRSCVCGGSNDNCRYCGGSGTIRDRLADAISSHAKRTDLGKLAQSAPSRPKQPFINTPQVNCPVGGCSAVLYPHRLVKHLRKSHGPITIELIHCPVTGCNAKLRAQELERHIRRGHVASSRSTDASGTILLAASKARAAHAALMTSSNSRSRMTSKPTTQVTGHRKEARTPEGSTGEGNAGKQSTLVSPRDKNLDATKGYAHSYREMGRYGSHPSHDGFDDESGPE